MNIPHFNTVSTLAKLLETERVPVESLSHSAWLPKISPAKDDQNIPMSKKKNRNGDSTTITKISPPKHAF